MFWSRKLEKKNLFQFDRLALYNLIHHYGLTASVSVSASNDTVSVLLDGGRTRVSHSNRDTFV